MEDERQRSEQNGEASEERGRPLHGQLGVHLER